MTRPQGYELIGIAWLFLAAYDRPVDIGTLFYVGAACWAFIRAIGRPTHPRYQKERT